MELFEDAGIDDGHTMCSIQYTTASSKERVLHGTKPYIDLKPVMVNKCQFCENINMFTSILAGVIWWM